MTEPSSYHSDHIPSVAIRYGGGYVESGRYIGDHYLYRYSCSCGWQGHVAYSRPDKARRKWREHLEETDSSDE